MCESPTITPVLSWTTIYLTADQAVPLARCVLPGLFGPTWTCSVVGVARLTRPSPGDLRLYSPLQVLVPPARRLHPSGWSRPSSGHMWRALSPPSARAAQAYAWHQLSTFTVAEPGISSPHLPVPAACRWPPDHAARSSVGLSESDMVKQFPAIWWR